MNNTLYSLLIPAASGLIAALLTYMTMRLRVAPTMQGALDQAVASVLSHYIDALAHSDLRLKDLGATLTQLSAQIQDLEDHIDALTTTITAAGLSPPPRKKSPIAVVR